MKIIVVAGFARSGKSTLARQLKVNGIPYASSSDILAIATLQYLGKIVTAENLKVLESKDEATFKSWGTRFNSIRHAKIYVAEGIIVPNFTRNYFVDRLINTAKRAEAQGKKLVVLFSTIPEEQQLLGLRLKELGYPTFGLNLVRSSEERTVDSRQLLDETLNIPIQTLVNDGMSKRELFQSFLSIHFDSSNYQARSQAFVGN